MVARPVMATFPCYFRNEQAPRTSRTTKAPGSQRAQPQAPERVRCWAVHWDGWWASALWRYQAWIPLSPPVRSWRVGGAVGGTTGALIGMGIPERQAKHYEVRVKEGGILLSAHSDNSDWAKRAKGILERTGAQDISSTGEADYIRSDKPLPRTTTGGEGAT